MKEVPLNDLKKELSFWAKQAASGQSLRVTKHHRPYVCLVPDRLPGLRQGSLWGKGELKPALQKSLQGKSLQALMEDREED